MTEMWQAVAAGIIGWILIMGFMYLHDDMKKIIALLEEDARRTRIRDDQR